MKNPNCDGDGPCHENQQVCVLPYSEDGNLIVCRSCYRAEMIYRRQRNFGLAKDLQFEIPSWDSLKIYEIGEIQALGMDSTGREVFGYK
jgi:hypothetical protein